MAHNLLGLTGRIEQARKAGEMLTVKSACIGVLVFLMWGCSGPDLVQDRTVEISGQDIRPYVGLIRNFSACDISIPSHDSSATLVLPARGQMEYIVWQPDVKLFGFIEGKQVYYRSLRVEPRKYTFFGKSYDFLAEVCPDIPDPIMIPQQCPPQCPSEPEPKPEPRRSRPRKVCPSWEPENSLAWLIGCKISLNIWIYRFEGTRRSFSSFSRSKNQPEFTARLFSPLCPHHCCNLPWATTHWLYLPQRALTLTISCEI